MLLSVLLLVLVLLLVSIVAVALTAAVDTYSGCCSCSADVLVD